MCYNHLLKILGFSLELTAHRILRDTNFTHKKVGVYRRSFFCIFANLFWQCENTSLTDFPGKRTPTNVRYLPPVCQRKRDEIHCYL